MSRPRPSSRSPETDALACQCCGYRTLATPATGASMQLCEVCGWEDSAGGEPDAMYHHGGNELSLMAAQAAFAATGASSPLFADAVRPPRPAEARAHGWRTIVERCADIVDDIRREFAGVTLGKGRSLYDAEVADMYGYVDYLTPEQVHVEACWEDVTADKLNSFGDGAAIVFLDHLGFRFYLPAFMQLAFTTNVELEWPLNRLRRADDAAALRALLTPAQSQVVRRWLELVAVATDWYARPARDVLRKGGWA